MIVTIRKMRKGSVYYVYAENVSFDRGRRYTLLADDSRTDPVLAQLHQVWLLYLDSFFMER